MRELKGIPDAVKRWAFCEMPGVKAFLIYKKKGRRVEAFCSCCGRYMEGISEAVTLEDQAVRLMRPEHNAESRCPECGVIGQWKSRGLCRGVYGKAFNYIFGQKIGEDFVFRACTCSLTVFKDTRCQIADFEYARVYLSRGKKPERYWKLATFEEERWTDKNPSWNGIGNSGIDRHHYYPGTFKEIEKTPMLKYGKNTGGWDPLAYYEAFSRYPDMEIVEKLGMTELARALLWQSGANINPRGKTVCDRLRINKDRLADLKAQKGSLNYLHIYQAERKAGHRLNDEEIAKEVYISNMWSRNERQIMRSVFEYTTVEHFEKYIKSQRKHIRAAWTGSVKQTYMDYIRMRIDRGYDISNAVILFPKNLRRRHNEMVEETREEKAAEHRRKMNEKWPQISKKFDKLNRKFNYSKDGFLIRPAMEAAEIADEGRELHHCVGSGDTYYSKHSKGESFILFLRRADEPDKPFATIEISGSRILQWYEAYDKKPDEKILQPWLDDYTKHLADKNKRKKAAAG